MINKITCFGVGGTDTRVYWLTGHVMETGIGSNRQWFTADLNHDDLSFTPDFKSSIACWALHGQFSRVYYFEDFLHLMEFRFYSETNQWIPFDLNVERRAPTGSPGSGIACLGLNNDVARIYYFDTNDSIVELAEVGGNEGWHVNNLSSLTGAPGTSSSRVITWFAAGGAASRVYYFDQHGNVIELAWGDDKKWHTNNISAAAKAPAASGISTIACFGVGGWATRVYYFDVGGNVIELGWGANNQWYWANIGVACGAPPAYKPSGITCFGVGTFASRIYYFDTGMNLIELGWGANNQWYWGNLTTAGNAPKANGPLTCFGVSGMLTRVYYQAGSPTKLWEVAFIDGGWHAWTIS